jgi:3'(2'), 5'-bisphosphate nucleotidase
LSAPRQTTERAADSAIGFDFARACPLLTDAAARAGAAIMRHYHEGPLVELKPDSSPVTLADRESEAIILAALQQLAPEIPVVSEEAASAPITKPASSFFLVDPLDGTKEFIRKRSDFTVNIALIEQGTPRFGLVYAPARSLLALTIALGTAIEADLDPSPEGAELAKIDGRLLRVREAHSERLVAVVSHSHLDSATEEFLSKLNVARRSSAGSSLKFLLIARGEADLYPRFGPTMEWDTAAGQAVLAAAGGKVVDAEGGPLRYGKIETGLLNPSFVAWGTSPTK